MISEIVRKCWEPEGLAVLKFTQHFTSLDVHSFGAMHCSFVNEREVLLLLVLQVELVVATEWLFVWCMIWECILLVDSTGHLERFVHICLALFQSNSGYWVTNVLPLCVLEGRFSDSLAAASRWEGVICIVDILCLAVQGNLIFFLVFLFMIELL